MEAAALTSTQPTLREYYPASRVLACPECDAAMVLRKSWKYPHPFYGCVRYPQCRATHGAHPDGAPMGIPANAETKQWRVQAHAAFDPLWGRNDPDIGDGERKHRRYIAYRWLGMKLGIEDIKRDCHIARFDIKRCQQVIAACEGVTWHQVELWHRGFVATSRFQARCKRRKRRG